MQQDYIIQKRPLTDQEIDLVYREIKTAPNITGYTKNEWSKFKDIFVAEKGRKLIGISLVKNLGENWSEMAVLYVLPEFRHKGIGRRLFYKAFEYLKSKNKNIYVASRNKMIVDILQTNQFKIINFSKIPCNIKSHIFKFALNFYRIEEYIRKFIKFRSKDKWVYGVRIINGK